MKVCTVCLFDEINLPEIELNDQGICSTCLINLKTIANTLAEQKTISLDERWAKIKRNSKRKYDCLIGISGGIDSSFMVLMAKRAGLNALLLHIDGGWNHPIAVTNMRKLIEWSGFDYEALVLDWNQLQDAQRAFVFANVMDIDLPFENALLKGLYATAKKHNIRSILFGYNAFTEGFLPANYTHYKLDKKNILAIHKQFGRRKIDSSQFIGTFEHLYITRVQKIHFEYPLNWINYNKAEAQAQLLKTINWEDYGGKHHENLYTQFYQEYILPKKFKIYKRIAHVSMLICSNQLSREQAEVEINKAVSIPEDALTYFCKKLDITQSEFEQYMVTEAVNHRAFKSDLDVYDQLKPVYSWFKKNVFSSSKSKFRH